MKIRPIDNPTDLPKVSDIPLGGILVKVGNSAGYRTGSWRTQRPIHNAEACTNCMLCWIHCPDSSIVVEDGKVTGIDEMHCKGCGICAEVCPTKPVRSIEMAQGGEY